MILNNKDHLLLAMDGNINTFNVEDVKNVRVMGISYFLTDDVQINGYML